MQFEIKGKDFYKDGKPIKIISGAVHYFRNMPDTWDDIFAKMKACGCNCVETYCAWNQHEKVKGIFDFSGILDVVSFIKKAGEYGLMAIVRPGPYICAEFDFGGLPWWLHNEPNMVIRCRNKSFIKCFDAYLDEMLSRLKPLLCTNGGNIIMMQVENEYSMYGDDKVYLRYIRDGYIARGIDVPLFTSDGILKEQLQDGTIEGCLPTINFGTNVEEKFRAHDEMFPNVPKMCMELWNGWFDAWGDEKHHTQDVGIYAQTVDDMLKRGSVNIYLFIGGTNFCFTSGANHYKKFAPTVTSYDYDALLTECGDTTEKYFAVRNVIQKYTDEPLPEVPHNREKKAYGSLKASQSASLFDNLENLSIPIYSDIPLPMEEYGIGNGYILYTSILERNYNNEFIAFESVGDRAQVYINDKHIGTVYTCDEDLKIENFTAKSGDRITILCESLARVNFGRKMMVRKGIVGILQVSHNKQHFGWEVYPLPMDNLDRIVWTNEIKQGTNQFYVFELNIQGEPRDTFLRTDNFRKGFVLINGFNIGRFWEIGPQKTLYVPKSLLKEGKNEIILFDGDGIKGEPIIEFTDKPDLG